MAVVKHIGPGSAFKIGLVLYAFFGLFAGVIMALFSMIFGSLGPLSPDLAPGAKVLGIGFGLVSIIILPVMYGVIGGVAGAISAALYNLIAGWMGGLEVDIG